MRCIYCNSEIELTLSDIITYAITGTKLTKSFVCKTHNAFTNDNYEKKFVSELDFFRHYLGLTTREGDLIKYKADISVDGIEIHNVKISNRDSLYEPKGIIVGNDSAGKKVLMGPKEKIEKIKKSKKIPIDVSNTTIHKMIKEDSFFGFYAVHSIAKIAYEWYCYINDITEYKEEYQEIVDYILGNIKEDVVDIIIDGNYYYTIDRMMEIGDNSLFQYDDIDGYRYVVFNLWRTISYRVKICQSPDKVSLNERLIFKVYLYKINGIKDKDPQQFEIHFRGFLMDYIFKTMRTQDITKNPDIWKVFQNRLGKIISTISLSIHRLKQEVEKISINLEKYQLGKIDFAKFLGFGDESILITIDVIRKLYLNIDKYDYGKTFNENLPIILNSDRNIIHKTKEDKREIEEGLMTMDKDNDLFENIRNWINVFNEIYMKEIQKNP